jgi:hypothetical protein
VKPEIKVKLGGWIVIVAVGVGASILWNLLAGFAAIVVIVYGVAMLFPRLERVTISQEGIVYEDLLQTIHAPWNHIIGFKQSALGAKVTTDIRGGNFSVMKNHPQANDLAAAVQRWLAHREQSGTAG